MDACDFVQFFLNVRTVLIISIEISLAVFHPHAETSFEKQSSAFEARVQAPKTLSTHKLELAG